jgi:hypothetical protein
VTTVISTASGLAWAEVVAVDASDADLAAYGLVDGACAEFRAVYGDGATFRLLLGDYVGEQCYARLADSRMVYLIAADTADQLMNKTFEAFRPSDVCPIDWTRLTAFDVSWPGGDAHVTVAVDGDAKTYSANGAALDADAVGNLLTQLSQLDSAGAATGVVARDALLRFTFYLDSTAYPEVPFNIYSYNSSGCLSELLGEGRLMISKESADSLVTQVESIFNFE